MSLNCTYAYKNHQARSISLIYWNMSLLINFYLVDSDSIWRKNRCVRDTERAYIWSKHWNHSHFCKSFNFLKVFLIFIIYACMVIYNNINLFSWFIYRIFPLKHQSQKYNCHFTQNLENAPGKSKQKGHTNNLWKTLV